MAIQKPEWFKVDPAKFLSDGQVEAMSTLELGACFRLLCRQWLDGFIPDDLRLLARLCRLDDAAMGEAWATLSMFFPIMESGKRANRFMWIEREKVVTELERRSDEGTRAARKRWDAARSKIDATPNALPNGSGIPVPMQEQTRAEQTRADINPLPQTTFADDRTAMPNIKKSKLTDAQIEQLYSLYPRKRDKLDAKKAISKAVSVVMAGDSAHAAMPLEEALDYLARRLKLYSQCVKGCDQDFIPYPATWFNAGGFWDDERDWSNKRNGKSNGHSTELPSDYDPASAQILRERELAGVAR